MACISRWLVTTIIMCLMLLLDVFYCVIKQFSKSKSTLRLAEFLFFYSLLYLNFSFYNPIHLNMLYIYNIMYKAEFQFGLDQWCWNAMIILIVIFFFYASFNERTVSTDCNSWTEVSSIQQLIKCSYAFYELM